MLPKVALLIASGVVPSLIALVVACLLAKQQIDISFIMSFFNTGFPKTDIGNRLILIGPGVIGMMLSSSLMLLEQKKRWQEHRWWLVLLWLVSCMPLSAALIAGVVIWY